MLGRDVGKQDGVAALGDGASSKHSPLRGVIEIVKRTRVGIYLDTVDMDRKIAAARELVAQVIAKGLV